MSFITTPRMTWVTAIVLGFCLGLIFGIAAAIFFSGCITVPRTIFIVDEYDVWLPRIAAIVGGLVTILGILGTWLVVWMNRVTQKLDGLTTARVEGAAAVGQLTGEAAARDRAEEEREKRDAAKVVADAAEATKLAAKEMRDAMVAMQAQIVALARGNPPAPDPPVPASVDDQQEHDKAQRDKTTASAEKTVVAAARTVVAASERAAEDKKIKP